MSFGYGFCRCGCHRGLLLHIDACCAPEDEGQTIYFETKAGVPIALTHVPLEVPKPPIA